MCDGRHVLRLVIGHASDYCPSDVTDVVVLDFSDRTCPNGTNVETPTDAAAHNSEFDGLPLYTLDTPVWWEQEGGSQL